MKIYDFYFISHLTSHRWTLSTIRFLHITPLDINNIPRLRSYSSYSSDFWLMYYFISSDLYYKSLQSFSCYAYYDFIWLPPQTFFDHIFWYVGRVSQGKTLIFHPTTSWFTTSVYVYLLGLSLSCNLTHLIWVIRSILHHLSGFRKPVFREIGSRDSVSGNRRYFLFIMYLCTNGVNTL